MATAEDFAGTEWAAICDAAHGAGLAMMLVGGSGLVGSMKEMLVAGRTAAAGAEDASELIRALCKPEAMGAMRARVAAVWQVGADPRLALQEAVIGWLREAVAALRVKAPGELEGYREWVLGFADSVANAGSEGSFLGMGGEKVSAEEARFLASVRGALEG
ncbi:MAG: hypothetical protein NTV52_28400 [Acidobacteria bacterium]|nr:hypothetical protein [Acidobacteriota bacterium]